MSVQFTRNATTVTLPDPAPGKALSERKRQLLDHTQGGTVVVQDLGVETYEVQLTFEMLTQTQKDALQSFFHTVADGALNTWTYTDELGNSYTARFLSPVLAFEQAAKDMYDVTLRLELSAMPA